MVSHSAAVTVCAVIMLSAWPICQASRHPRLTRYSNDTLAGHLVVPAGTLRVVSYVSMDGYTGREFILQPNERWRVLVGSAATAYTNDIADFVVSDTQTGSLPGIVTGGGNVKIEHWSIGTADYSSPNSVVPVSLCLRVD
jgi:hypothetical protein